MYFLMFDYCTYLHINLTLEIFLCLLYIGIFIIVVIPLDTSVVLKGLPCLLLTFLCCLHHMSVVLTLIIQFIWANLRMSVRLGIDYVTFCLCDCIMFSIHFSLSQSEAGLGVWSLGSAEESQNSVDLTHISVDVRNLHFEENFIFP